MSCIAPSGRMPVHDAHGDIRAMRFHMGSGTYLCTVVKETSDESH